ncbi:MAG: oxidoreductase, partial [Gammaproteobacteria bacterium]|nr:oxidoreductase [Gammaproteobacteria bacterium]
MVRIAVQRVSPARSVELVAALLAIGWLATGARSQELQQVTAAGVKAILTEPGVETIGARHPDVTIVEYFDYNCPYCRRIVPTFRALVAGDKKIAIVYKDWPVLGASSMYAARCALAARWQGKYLVAHDALLSGPRLSENVQIEQVLRGAGVNVDALKKDLIAHAGEIA